MSDREDLGVIGHLISSRWPGCTFATQPGDPSPSVIIGREAQAFIVRGPFTNLGWPTGEQGSFYAHADAPTELAALLLAFARALSSPLPASSGEDHE
jgi:hypothetical protein